jgi:hypothetical protein
MRYKVKKTCDWHDYVTGDNNFTLSIGNNTTKKWQTLGTTKVAEVTRVDRVGVYLRDDGSVHVVVI